MVSSPNLQSTGFFLILLGLISISSLYLIIYYASDAFKIAQYESHTMSYYKSNNNSRDYFSVKYNYRETRPKEFTNEIQDIDKSHKLFIEYNQKQQVISHNNTNDTSIHHSITSNKLESKSQTIKESKSIDTVLNTKNNNHSESLYLTNQVISTNIKKSENKESLTEVKDNTIKQPIQDKHNNKKKIKHSKKRSFLKANQDQTYTGQTLSQSIKFFDEESRETLNLKDSSQSPLLTLATTYIETDNIQKIHIQENSLRSLTSLFPYVQLVVMTTSPFWIQHAQEHGAFVYTNIKTNYYNTPLFKPMMQYLENNYNSTFYGYINGDILLHSRIIDTLQYVKILLEKQAIKQKLLMVGRRINCYLPHDFTLSLNTTRQDEYLIEQSRIGEMFQTDAEDYFIFTKNTFPWESMVDIVIGRPGYDNYLVEIIWRMRETHTTIDTTNSILAIHQTDKDGSKAGFARKNIDLRWNLNIIGNIWWNGRTTNCEFKLDYTSKDSLRLIPRRTSTLLSYDDIYTDEEYYMFHKYIHKSNDICIYMGSDIVTGTLLSLCKYTYIYVLSQEGLIQSKSFLKSYNNYNIEQKIGYHVNTASGINSVNSYMDYYMAPQNLNKHFNILILDGRIRPQLALSMLKLLDNDGYIYIHDCLDPDRKHYHYIDEYLDLIDIVKNTDYVAGHEVYGLCVYKKKNSAYLPIYHPNWW